MAGYEIPDKASPMPAAPSARHAEPDGDEAQAGMGGGAHSTLIAHLPGGHHHVVHVHHHGGRQAEVQEHHFGPGEHEALGKHMAAHAAQHGGGEMPGRPSGPVA